MSALPPLGQPKPIPYIRYLLRGLLLLVAVAAGVALYLVTQGLNNKGEWSRAQTCAVRFHAVAVGKGPPYKNGDIIPSERPPYWKYWAAEKLKSGPMMAYTFRAELSKDEGALAELKLAAPACHFEYKVLP